MRAAIEASGDKVPVPEVPPGFEWVWRAWVRLHDDRPWYGGGMGSPIPGAIAWRDVRDWCEFHDYPGEAVPYLDRLLRAMDVEYRAWHKERSN